VYRAPEPLARDLTASLPVIMGTSRSFWNPAPKKKRKKKKKREKRFGDVPILSGGTAGEGPTLRLVRAGAADGGNSSGPPSTFAAKNRRAERTLVSGRPANAPAQNRAHCRHPAPHEIDDWQAYLEAGRTPTFHR